MQQKNGSVISYLVVISLIDFMGLGIVVAIFPHLLLEGGIFPASWSHGFKLFILGFFLAVYPLGQFFAASLLGKLSDIYGRKKLLLLTLIGTLFSFILSGISLLLQSVMLLLLSRLLSGIFAGNVAIAQASMADISTDINKAKNMTLLQFAMGMSWVVGPPLGGWLSEISLFHGSGFATPFWFIAFILLALIVYTGIFYKETLLTFSKHEKLHLFSGVTQIVTAYKRYDLRTPLLVWTIFVAGWWLFEGFIPTFLLQQFNFSSGQIGNFLASMGATYALFQYLIVNKVAIRYQPSTLVKCFLLLSAVAMLGIAAITTIWQLHLIVTLYVASMAFVLPSLITSISNLAGQEAQGEIMGNISSIQALSTVVMMAMGGLIGSTNIKATIIAGGILLFFSWFLYLYRFHSAGVQSHQAPTKY